MIRAVRLLRIHQWSKNLIIFVPLITAHRFFEPQLLAASGAAFFAFSFVASGLYVLNDIFDCDHDRRHKNKRHRPIASGSVKIHEGLAAALFLGATGFSIACFLPKGFLFCLLIYALLSLLYSVSIKKLPLADVTLLAGLYTIRLIAGHEVTDVKYSVWLLAFGIFFFFSLALAKRFVELQRSDNQNRIAGRGFRPSDLALVESLGVSSGLVSVLVVILYVNSAEVRVLYDRPLFLVLLAPLLIYWIGRLWLLASRGVLHEDPVLFALHDWASYLMGAAVLGVILLSTF